MSIEKTLAKRAYLAGPMEYDKDAGIAWRLEYQEALRDLGISCVIPELEEDFITDQAELNVLKKHNVPKYVKIMRKLIELDLNFVKTLDLVIVNWEGQRMSGTVHEVGYAYQIGKPCYLVTSKSPEEVPGWFLACFTEIFSSLDQLLLHLQDG